MPLKAPQSCEFSEIFQNYRAKKIRLVTSAATSQQERMRKNRSAGLHCKTQQGCFLLLLANLLFQLYLIDVWFMVAVVPITKIWIFLSIKWLSSEMTSLKRRIEGRSGRNLQREGGQNETNRSTPWFARSISNHKISIDSLPLFPGWRCLTEEIWYQMTSGSKASFEYRVYE